MIMLPFPLSSFLYKKPTHRYKGYYQKKEEKLILKEAEIKRKNDLALTVVSDNPIIQIFSKIKNMILRYIK